MKSHKIQFMTTSDAVDVLNQIRASPTNPTPATIFTAALVDLELFLKMHPDGAKYQKHAETTDPESIEARERARALAREVRERIEAEKKAKKYRAAHLARTYPEFERRLEAYERECLARLNIKQSEPFNALSGEIGAYRVDVQKVGETLVQYVPDAAEYVAAVTEYMLELNAAVRDHALGTGKRPIPSAPSKPHLLR